MFAKLKRGVIYDLGAHHGEDTYFYLKKGFKVIAVEPNPKLAGRIREVLGKWLRRGQLIVEEAAIAKRDGAAALYVNRTWDSWSSLSQEIGERGTEGAQSLQVRTASLEGLIAQHGTPYYVKVDIEGLDHLALEALKNVHARPRYISVENGSKNLRETLIDLGYSQFKWVNQSRVASQRLPFPPKEGRFCFHRFRYGCSGAFGEEAPGHWVPLEEVEPLIEAYWSLPFEDRTSVGWFDLHAKID